MLAKSLSATISSILRESIKLFLDAFSKLLDLRINQTLLSSHSIYHASIFINYKIFIIQIL